MQIVEELITQVPPPGRDDTDTNTSSSTHVMTETTPQSSSESIGVQATPCRRNIRTQVKPNTKSKGVYLSSVAIL